MESVGGSGFSGIDNVKLSLARSLFCFSRLHGTEIIVVCPSSISCLTGPSKAEMAHTPRLRALRIASRVGGALREIFG